jgi:hypothetical protein
MHTFDLIPEPVVAVERRMSTLATVLNTTGLYTALRHDERFQAARHAGVELLTAGMAGFANARVHESLNVIEKIGFDPLGRVARRKQYAAVAVGVGQFGLQVGIDIALRKAQERSVRQGVRDLASWMGFVHGESATLRMQASLAAALTTTGVPDPDILGYYERGVGCSLPALPRPSDRRQLHSMLLDVAAVTDTKVPQKAARLQQLASLAGVTDKDVEVAVEDFDETNEFSSDVAGLSGDVIKDHLGDIFTALSGARQAAVGAYENDPYAAMRTKRRELVTKLGVPVAMAGLTYFTGGVGDFLLVAAAPVVNSAIGNKDSVETMLRISKALRTATAAAGKPGGRHA